MPVGAAGGGNTRKKAKITHGPVASFTRTDNFEEICTLLTSVISAALSASCHENPCGTSHSRSSMRVRARKMAQDLVECRWNLGDSGLNHRTSRGGGYGGDPGAIDLGHEPPLSVDGSEA